MNVLRQALLEDCTVILAGGHPPELRERLLALGADVHEHPGAQVAADVLVYDARDALADGGRAGLERVLEQVWTAIREVLAERSIPAHRAGKLVLIAPAPSAGQLSDAAGAALENLARTLSTEWARHGITTSVIAPGDDDDAQQLAELVCFLASRAGDYFSGARFSLNALGG